MIDICNLLKSTGLIIGIGLTSVVLVSHLIILYLRIRSSLRVGKADAFKVCYKLQWCLYVGFFIYVLGLLICYLKK